MVATRMPLDLPSWLNTPVICAASSRVGASTRAASSVCWASRWMIGRAKAAVLPVPVWARPMTSLPSRAAGMHCGLDGGGPFETCGPQVFVNVLREVIVAELCLLRLYLLLQLNV